MVGLKSLALDQNFYTRLQSSHLPARINRVRPPRLPRKTSEMKSHGAANFNGSPGLIQRPPNKLFNEITFRNFPNSRRVLDLLTPALLISHFGVAYALSNSFFPSFSMVAAPGRKKFRCEIRFRVWSNVSQRKSINARYEWDEI